ncbi:MAG: Xaa-Pro peptidase family protein [Deltaproteobacteria bacterium]|jgi:Xaa-Pro aminopeptidase|nr:Xaa-Pro peptidase family protein [Deltaproteobacteria bacterium]
MVPRKPNGTANETKKERKKPVRRVYEDPIPGRLGNLRERMAENGVSAALVKSPENRRYFSGFSAEDSQLAESSGFLLVTEDRKFLLTDGRYTTQALREAPGYEVVTHGGRDLGEKLKECLPDVKSLAFEANHVTVGFHNVLKRSLAGVKLRTLPFSLDVLREVKSPEELEIVRKAVNITERALADLWAEIEPGVPESWLSEFLLAKFKEYGSTRPAFPPIVAAGANAAQPHAVPGRKKVSKTEMVVLDLGATYRGYASDMTRTYVPKLASGWQKTIYGIVRDAQLMALDSIKAGVAGAEVDKVARDHITKHGYGEFFNHSLGHGVGLLVHEEPRLSPHATSPLKAGSLVTVEPGIYLPEKGGVRLEELVLVTETGCVVLNKDKHFYDFS